MVNFIWHDTYLLGNSTIDQQHQKLFALANNLVNPENKENLIENALLLYRHVREHFQTEEAFMKTIHYPDATSHTDNHNSMLDQLVLLTENINKNTWQQSDVLNFMQTWILHIIHQDVGIKEFFQTTEN